MKVNWPKHKQKLLLLSRQHALCKPVKNIKLYNYTIYLYNIYTIIFNKRLPNPNDTKIHVCDPATFKRPRNDLCYTFISIFSICCFAYVTKTWRQWSLLESDEQLCKKKHQPWLSVQTSGRADKVKAVKIKAPISTLRGCRLQTYGSAARWLLISNQTQQSHHSSIQIYWRQWVTNDMFVRWQELWSTSLWVLVALCMSQSSVVALLFSARTNDVGNRLYLLLFLFCSLDGELFHCWLALRSKSI